MKDLLFPLLSANDIEVRVGNFNKEKTKGTLLLYKTARTDAKYLDQIVGVFNWQKKFYELKGTIYCSLGIYFDERKEWVWKDDAGAESDIEREKGSASDSFKRAGFAWGLGRELYSAPTIWVDRLLDYTDIEVESITYNDDRTIKDLVIVGKDKANGYEKVQLYPKAKKVAQKGEKQTNKGYVELSEIKVGDTFRGISQDQKEIINAYMKRFNVDQLERFLQNVVSNIYGCGTIDMLSYDQAQEIINKYVNYRK